MLQYLQYLQYFKIKSPNNRGGMHGMKAVWMVVDLVDGTKLAEDYKEKLMMAP